MAFGEGLTSQILQPRSRCSSTGAQDSEALGARRRDAGEVVPRRADPRRRRGDRRRSASRARGQEGRFGEADDRGCWPPSPPTSASRSRTPASTARPSAGRRDGRPRGRRPRDLGHARPRRRSSSAIVERALTLLTADTSAVFLAEPDGQTFRPIVARRADRRRSPGRPDPARRGDHRRLRRGDGAPRSSTTCEPTRGPSTIPGTDDDDRGPPDGRAAASRATRSSA